MGINEFKNILKKFLQAFNCVKPLYKKIRGMLFSYENGLLIEISPGIPKKLYNFIIEIFDNAIINVATGQNSK